MTAVKLTRMWFAPGGTRYRPGDYDDLPEALLDHVPSSAYIAEGDKFVPANEWQEKHGKKRAKGKVDVGAFQANAGPASPEISLGVPNPDAESQSVPANAEGASPTSPKSSGPETTALPSSTSKAGEVTASGSEAKKDESVTKK